MSMVKPLVHMDRNRFGGGHLAHADSLACELIMVRELMQQLEIHAKQLENKVKKEVFAVRDGPMRASMTDPYTYPRGALPANTDIHHTLSIKLNRSSDPPFHPKVKYHHITPAAVKKGKGKE